MIFDIVSGTSTSYTENSISDNDKSFITDYYRGWVLSINDNEYEIKGNTESTITLVTNISLNDNASYTISLITRSELQKQEPKASDESYFNTTLIETKIRETYLHYESEIFANFKELLNQFSDGELPQDYIYNLFRIKKSMIYYCLSELFDSQAIQDDDFALFKADNYAAKAEKYFKNKVNLLTVDLDSSGDLSNDELSRNMSKNMIFGR